MASATMAAQAVTVAGLGSSMLREGDVQRLRGHVKLARRLSSQLYSPVRAAKLPPGPREEPKLPVPLWGFTRNAEVWNSRASMIGIVGIIIVEAIINQGILQAIGVDVGKGLDLPL
uniref:Uncharacterized protein n=1 Tax=Physcomitrium patens TaxID=3218 RepID=A0A7I4F9C9_PHYPA